MPNPADDHELSESMLDRAIGDVEPSPLPIGPSGGFTPAMDFEPETIPAATPATMVCLRGPCEHYQELAAHFASGNPKGTLSRPYKIINRFCNFPGGESITLTDELVYSCNRWCPESPEDHECDQKIRDAYLNDHPEFKE
jgi:hypothetical protein